MAARSYLFIADAASPLVRGETPLAVAGLSRALASAGNPATVLCLASPEAAAQIPGLARRLRTLSGRAGGRAVDIPVYEGPAPASQARLIVAAHEGANRAESAALLSQALRALGGEGLLNADVAIAWGETAAPALARSAAPIRGFVIPSGRVGPPLSDAECEALGDEWVPNELGGRSLAAVGAAAASVIVAPSAAAARALESDPGLAARASDEPFVPIRFGCDDPPHDPASDPALAATYTSQNLAGKLECRRALLRRHALSLGLRGLLLAAAHLRRGKGGEELLEALPALADLDVAVIVSDDGDADLVERAKRLALQSPGRLSVVATGEADDRLIRAAADALLLADSDDRTARAAGLAQRYGTIPIAPDRAANRDFLVDFDQASATGSAILYGDRAELVGAVRRTLALRAEADAWTSFVRRTIELAPKWVHTATSLEEICGAYAV